MNKAFYAIPEMEFGLMILRKDATLFFFLWIFMAFVAMPLDLCPQNVSSKKSVENSGKTSTKKTVTQTNKTKSLENPKNSSSIVHKVSKGENLYRISLKYKVTMDEIMRANNLKNENSVFTGMTLKIPTANNSTINSNTNNSKTKTEEKKPSATVAKSTTPSKNTNFSWPIKNVISCKQDGLDGVKPIGLIIRAPAGASVHSSAEGIVQRIGYMRGYGNFVLVKHPGDYFTIYSYLENITVKKGQEIKKGTRLGSVDSNTQSVHFQIDRNGKALNPLTLLPKRS